MKNDDAIEQQIQAKGLNAPRLTPADIDAVIVDETYTVLPSGKVMVCELTLRNGYTVRGEAATVSKENFDVDIGQKISRENARNKVWELEGYLLQEKLAQENPASRAWGCSDCCQVFPEGIPAECPNNAVGCNELLAKGK